jgi:hypothetical protein
MFLRLRFFSDGTNRDDGVYVDNTAVKCLSHGGAAYNTISGTSMATPHVAGVAALALANNPSLTVAQLKAAILDGVDVVPGLASFVAESGRLNAAKALGLVPDDTAPNTSITGGPSGSTSSHRATFRFSGAGAGGRYECKHMSGAWQPCTSPKQYRGLGNGKHTFQVRAIDSNGNADQSPAKRTWRVT